MKTYKKNAIFIGAIGRFVTCLLNEEIYLCIIGSVIIVYNDESGRCIG